MTPAPFVRRMAEEESRPLARCEPCKGGAHMRCPDRARLLAALRAAGKPFSPGRPPLGWMRMYPRCSCLASPCHPTGGFEFQEAGR